MGHDPDLGVAFGKSQIAAGQDVPLKGSVFISVKDYDKHAILPIGRKFADMGFEILATPGTAELFRNHAIAVTKLPKLDEGRPNILDYIKNRTVALVINTPSGPKPRRDEIRIRGNAIDHAIPIVTTVSAARAMVNAIGVLRKGSLSVQSLQEIYKKE